MRKTCKTQGKSPAMDASLENTSFIQYTPTPLPLSLTQNDNNILNLGNVFIISILKIRVTLRLVWPYVLYYDS